MTTVPIPESDWVWCGYAGHLIVAASCHMHLHTRVGDFRISTVGDYHPADLDDPRGKPTKDARPIGAGAESLYETFVFRVSGEGEHGEGEPVDWTEIDTERYAKPVDAERGHMEFCRKYARIAVGLQEVPA